MQYFTFACAKDPELWKYEGEKARTYKMKAENIIQKYKDSGATVLIIDENVRPVERRIYYDKAPQQSEIDHEHFSEKEVAKESITKTIVDMTLLSHHMQCLSDLSQHEEWQRRPTTESILSEHNDDMSTLNEPGLKEKLSSQIANYMLNDNHRPIPITKAGGPKIKTQNSGIEGKIQKLIHKDYRSATSRDEYHSEVQNRAETYMKITNLPRNIRKGDWLESPERNDSRGSVRMQPEILLPDKTDQKKNKTEGR